MVALLVSAYFCLRAVESASWYVAGAAGLAAGYSIAIKPSNSIFLVAPALLLLVTRWRAVLWFAVGLAPALVTLALWKYRGLGELAAAPAERVRVAAGVDSLLNRIHNPELNSWQHLHQVFLGVAGALLGRAGDGVASGRGSDRPPAQGHGAAFLLIGSWFAVFLLVKGTYVQASVEDASFWRIMMPAYPAYLILAASVVLLVPGLRARPAPASFALAGRRLKVVIAVAAAVFVVLPLGVIAATPPLHDQGRQAVIVGDTLVPGLGGSRARGVGGERDGEPHVEEREVEDRVAVLPSPALEPARLHRLRRQAPKLRRRLPPVHGSPSRPRRDRRRTSTAQAAGTGPTASASQPTGSTIPRSATSTS